MPTEKMSRSQSVDGADGPVPMSQVGAELEAARALKSARRVAAGLLIGLLLSSTLAYNWPLVGSLIPRLAERNPFELTPTSLWLLIGLTMFALGAVIDRGELGQLRQHPLSVLLGLITQCTCMPALAWLVVRQVGLDGELAIGVLLVGCVPGAMASNVLTLAARGNVSYSISLTVVATLLSPVTVPLALYVVGGIVAESGWSQAADTATRLLLYFVLPVVAAFLTKETITAIRPTLKMLAPVIASGSLLWIIASVVAGNRDRLLQISPQLLLALLLINLAGYVAGWSVGRLAQMPVSIRRALALEVGMQNAGVGTALAASLLGAGTVAQIPTAAYTFGCMLTGTVLASLWAQRPVDIASQDSDADL